ncbi:MAG: DUF1893 domain-containing protein [Candidatus Bathyarchaeota archaeon]|nr:DUF1893 domain-containing protein [Candidatus Bathyarchaeota archaeon]
MFRIEMHDLECARLRLRAQKLSLVVVKDRKVIYESGSHGITSFLEAAGILGTKLAGSAVADKIVGRAVAFLCVHFQVSAVFAVVLSIEGVHVLKDNNVFYQFEKCVPHIQNQKGNGMCPFERLALTFTTPEEAYRKLRECKVTIGYRSSSNEASQIRKTQP